jgi:hypothetical protein
MNERRQYRRAPPWLQIIGWIKADEDSHCGNDCHASEEAAITSPFHLTYTQFERFGVAENDERCFEMRLNAVKKEGRLSRMRSPVG